MRLERWAKEILRKIRAPWKRRRLLRALRSPVPPWKPCDHPDIEVLGAVEWVKRIRRGSPDLFPSPGYDVEWMELNAWAEKFNALPAKIRIQSLCYPSSTIVAFVDPEQSNRLICARTSDKGFKTL